MKKKGQFDVINAGLMAFLTFAVIVILVVVLISVTKKTQLVCEDTADNGGCFKCRDDGASNFTYNASDNFCHNTSLNGLTSNRVQREAGGTAAYNSTLRLADAAGLPSQFAEILIIVVIFIGVLAVLAFAGYAIYNKTNK